MTEQRSIDDYLKLPYTIQIRRETLYGYYSGWSAEIVELPGCFTQADTFAEIERRILDAMRSWMEAALDTGMTIPLPEASHD